MVEKEKSEKQLHLGHQNTFTADFYLLFFICLLFCHAYVRLFVYLVSHNSPEKSYIPNRTSKNPPAYDRAYSVVWPNSVAISDGSVAVRQAISCPLCCWWCCLCFCCFWVEKSWCDFLFGTLEIFFLLSIYYITKRNSTCLW